MTAIQDQENAVFLKEQDPDANTFFIPLNSVDQNFERTPFSTLDAPPLPKGLRFIDIFLDRVFLIGKNNRIYFSAVGEPDRFPAGNAFDTGSDNLAFTALKAAPWGLIFGKANSVSVLRGDPLSVGMSSALGGIGIKFNTSILIHKNIAYFLANDGIYAFDGFNSNNLTRDFNKAEIALMLGKTAVFAFFDNHFFNFMGSDGETWCFDTDFKRWDKKKYPFAALRYLDVQSRHGGAAGEMAMASGAFMLGLSGATRGYMRVSNGEANFDLATWNSVTSKFDKEEPVISAPFSIKFKTQKLGSASARRRWYWLYLDCSSSPFAFGGVDGKMFVTVTSDEVSESDTFPDGSEPLSRLNIFSTQGRENLLFGLDPRVLGRFVDVEVTVHSGTEIHGLELLSEKMSGGKNDDL